MGDRLLKEISTRLLRCIRSRDYAFRIGGDEFALIVSADMDEEQRSRMAERIQTMLSAPIVIEGKCFRSASAAAAPAIRRTATLRRCASRRTAVCTRKSSTITKTTGRRTVMKHKTLRCTAETAALLLTEEAVEQL